MSLKNHLEGKLGIPIRVRAGAPGSFTVLLDGEQIYSKKQEGRSAEPAEILKRIRLKSPQ